MRVLIVCTGNTCRSPMAAALMRRALDAAGLADVAVESAGIFAREGDPATSEAIFAMAERGVNLSGHRARALRRDMLPGALVLCMTERQVRDVKRLEKSADARRIAEYAGLSGDISDPYGGTLDCYRRTAGLLDDCARRIAAKLADEHG